MRFIAHIPEMSGSPSHSVFSLQTSAFNDFLYAPVGEEDNGMVLTALSALARLGVDPWDEAARLSELPKEAATTRLTSIVSSLPHGRWAQSAAAGIAVRLVALLPVKPALPSAHQAAVRVKAPASAAMAMFVFVILINAFVFFVQRDHASQRAPAPTQSTTEQGALPRVPVPGGK